MIWSDMDTDTVTRQLGETPDAVADDFPALCKKYGAVAVARKLLRLKDPAKEAEQRTRRHDKTRQKRHEQQAEEDRPDGLDPFLGLLLNRVQKAQKKKTDPQTVVGLANALDVGPARVQDGIAALIEQGYRLQVKQDQVQIAAPTMTGYNPIPLDHYREGDWYELGIVSDSHLCNQHARLDVLNAAYDLFEDQGIRVVLHAGNYLDGERNFNRGELITPPGIERQMGYFLDHYPQREGIQTFYIDGEDHEGWYNRDIGLNTGQTVEDRARRRGRTDLTFLGLHEVDIPFWAKDGKSPAILKLMHGGGGSSYAISYIVQKYIESFSSGEKPHIVLFGHFHKEMYAHIRGVHSLHCASTIDQTLWMRKLRISSVVGFHIVRFKVDKLGIVSRFQVEWFPFYNVGYYKDRYTPGTVGQIIATPHDDADWIQAVAESLALGDKE